VRGQTPKVAKQDKKKLPKGRAIKRLKVRVARIARAASSSDEDPNDVFSCSRRRKKCRGIGSVSAPDLPR
jgi:ribosomal protein S30